jgi:hypothetical protein
MKIRTIPDPQKRLQAIEHLTDILWQARHIAAEELDMIDTVAAIMKIIVYELDPEHQFICTEFMPQVFPQHFAGIVRGE